MVCLHQLPDAFEREEGRMSLVQMVNARLNAQRLERATAADAQHHLLLQSHLGVAAVKLKGDSLIGRGVLLDVRIEQVERDATHLRAPDLRGDFAAGILDFDDQRLAVTVAFERQRQVVKIVVPVFLLLPPGFVQVLSKVSLLVKQSDGDERHAQIARRFQMTPGENAQTASENRKTICDAEFGREISDQEDVSSVVMFTEPG